MKEWDDSKGGLKVGTRAQSVDSSTTLFSLCSNALTRFGPSAQLRSSRRFALILPWLVHAYSS